MMTDTDVAARRALEWVIAISDEECTASTLAGLDAWFAEDPEHERIFWQVDAAWRAAILCGDSASHPAARDGLPPIEQCVPSAASQPARIEDRFVLHALEFESVLRACLYRYSRNVSDVEELLQETYARLLIAGQVAQPKVRSMRAFVLTVARNVALDWLRHRQTAPVDLVADMEALDVLDEGAQIEEIVNAHQELALLASAVEQLPTRCRQVFVLRKVYGFSSQEIASRLQISEDTVDQHLTKAARRCAQVLFESPDTSKRDNDMFVKLRNRMKLRNAMKKYDKSAS